MIKLQDLLLESKAIKNEMAVYKKRKEDFDSEDLINLAKSTPKMSRSEFLKSLNQEEEEFKKTNPKGKFNKSVIYFWWLNENKIEEMEERYRNFFGLPEKYNIPYEISDGAFEDKNGYVLIYVGKGDSTKTKGGLVPRFAQYIMVGDKSTDKEDLYHSFDSSAHTTSKLTPFFSQETGYEKNEPRFSRKNLDVMANWLENNIKFSYLTLEDFGDRISDNNTYQKIDQAEDFFVKNFNIWLNKAGQDDGGIINYSTAYTNEPASRFYLGDIEKIINIHKQNIENFIKIYKGQNTTYNGNIVYKREVLSLNEVLSILDALRIRFSNTKNKELLDKIKSIRDSVIGMKIPNLKNDIGIFKITGFNNRSKPFEPTIEKTNEKFPLLSNKPTSTSSTAKKDKSKTSTTTTNPTTSPTTNTIDIPSDKIIGSTSGFLIKKDWVDNNPEFKDELEVFEKNPNFYKPKNQKRFNIVKENHEITRMQELAGLKEFEEFNPDDYNEDNFKKDINDMRKLGFNGVNPDDMIELAVKIWAIHDSKWGHAEYDIYKEVKLPAETVAEEVENYTGEYWDFDDLSLTKKDFQNWVFDELIPSQVQEIIEKYPDQMKVEVEEGAAYGASYNFDSVDEIINTADNAGYYTHGVSVL